MNYSFYKILKFELKLNFKIWILFLATAFTILTFFFFKFHAQNNSSVIGGSFISIFTLIASIFTLHSYSESTTRITMGMYHLLPISGNTKFFSKQLITFFIFPIILLLLYLFFVLLVDPLIFDKFNRSLVSPNFKPIRTFNIYLWTHSISTFFAIVFKKRKLLYAILVYFAFALAMGIYFAIFGTPPSPQKVTNIPLSFLKNLPKVTYFIIPLIFYIISYRLFFKRQL